MATSMATWLREAHANTQHAIHAAVHPIKMQRKATHNRVMRMILNTTANQCTGDQDHRAPASDRHLADEGTQGRQQHQKGNMICL